MAAAAGFAPHPEEAHLYEIFQAPPHMSRQGAISARCCFHWLEFAEVQLQEQRGFTTPNAARQVSPDCNAAHVGFLRSLPQDLGLTESFSSICQFDQDRDSTHQQSWLCPPQRGAQANWVSPHSTVRNTRFIASICQSSRHKQANQSLTSPCWSLHLAGVGGPASREKATKSATACGCCPTGSATRAVSERCFSRPQQISTANHELVAGAVDMGSTTELRPSVLTPENMPDVA